MVAGRPQMYGKDPANDRTIDDGSRENAVVGWFRRSWLCLGFCRRRSLKELHGFQCSRDPLAALENVCLQRHCLSRPASSIKKIPELKTAEVTSAVNLGGNDNGAGCSSTEADTAATQSVLGLHSIDDRLPQICCNVGRTVFCRIAIWCFPGGGEAEGRTISASHKAP